MDIQWQELVVWLVVGAAAGHFVGWVVTGRREGLGWLKNTLSGLAGGVVGGFLFVKIFNLDPFEISKVTVSLQQIVAAVLGSLLVLLLLKFLRRKRAAE